jgi:sodium/potassium/calcium exchanger 4
MVQFRTVVCLLSFLVLSLAACPSQVECRAVVPSQANVAEHAPVEVDQMMAESPRELKTAKANVTEPGTDEAAEVGAGKHVSVALKLTMYIVLLLITFVTLAIVCDDYLAEALEELSEALHIPHDVACASFLAFGSSAPEICINCIATARGKVDVSMGAIMGSGILAYTVIPAVCVLVSNGQTLHLELVPLIRDCVSYLVALLLFVLFVMNGSMGLREDVVLVSLFFVYIALQFVLGKFYHAPGADLETPSEVSCFRVCTAIQNSSWYTH